MYKQRCATLAALIFLAPAAQLYAEAPTGDAANTPAGKEHKPTLARLLKNADSNGDQKLDLAEIHAKLPNFPADRFKTLDTNQDGFLEAGEFPQRPKAEGASAEAAKGEMGQKLKAADTDQDGKLSQAEFSAGFPNAPAERFAALDRNGDGFLDRSDRKESGEAKGETKAQKEKSADGTGNADHPRGEAAMYLKNLIKDNDTDKDGKLTKAELESAKPGFPEKTFAAMDRDQDGSLTEADLAHPKK